MSPFFFLSFAPAPFSFLVSVFCVCYVLCRYYVCYVVHWAERNSYTRITVTQHIIKTQHKRSQVQWDQIIKSILTCYCNRLCLLERGQISWKCLDSKRRPRQFESLYSIWTLPQNIHFELMTHISWTLFFGDIKASQGITADGGFTRLYIWKFTGILQGCLHRGFPKILSIKGDEASLHMFQLKQ